MPKGVVKWFNNTAKYGFIISEEGKEIFVHFSEIQVEGYKTLKRGDMVQFEIEQTPKGIRAIHVLKLGREKPIIKDVKKNRHFRRAG